MAEKAPGCAAGVPPCSRLLMHNVRAQLSPPVLQARRQSDQHKRTRMQQALQTGQRIIIDLDFEECMTEGEIKSLCQQLIYCYSSNLNAAAPCNLVLASFQGKIAAQLAKQASGFEHWQISTQAGPLRSLDVQRA